MPLKVVAPVVNCQWLYEHLEHKDLILFDATIQNVTAKPKQSTENKKQIKNAIFFDIKNRFSDSKATLPNTVLSPNEFKVEARNLGVNKDSCLIVYDDLGVYSSPRVWWMFQLMGFTNIAVLEGGFPEWIKNNYPIETPKKIKYKKGNFIVDYQPKQLKLTNDILFNIEKQSFLVLDARSKGRFFATEAEPRSDVKGGHIPNSKSLPYTEVVSKGKFKDKATLQAIFKDINADYKPLVFSCGSGITASILALAATIADYKNTAVYDGSWTEWGTTVNLPIAK